MYCARCGRRLHDKESQKQGMGPKCAAIPDSKKIIEMIERIRQPELFEVKDGKA